MTHTYRMITKLGLLVVAVTKVDIIYKQLKKSKQCNGRPNIQYNNNNVKAKRSLQIPWKKNVFSQSDNITVIN